MSDKEQLWQGVSESARAALRSRDYDDEGIIRRIVTSGVDAAELVSLDRTKPEARGMWIPGVEVFSRKIHPQRHRGVFGELVRRDEDVLGKIKFWPVQWSSARMFGQTAKGFHIHPPNIPSRTSAEEWLNKVFVEDPENYALRPYGLEQWDVIFFVQGVAEMILRDVRDGFPRRTMRFFVDGDNHRSANNVGVVVPPGVAHAIRVEGTEDLVMVYGTSTLFHPEFEGRIASEIESLALPGEWQKFLSA